MKNEKGITLTSLVIMIIVLIILASIATYSGVGTIRYTNYNKAKAEMQIMQANTNDWYQKVKEGKAQITDYGKELSEANQSVLQKTIEATGISVSNFRFFPEDYLNKNLGLNHSFDFLVDISTRTVILFGGYTYNGMIYYTAEDFGLLNVPSNDIGGITFSLAQGDNTDIVISDVQLDGSIISKFLVQYKKDGETSWSDVTSSLTKFTDEDDGNKVKYKFKVNDYTTYYVKVTTFDKTIENNFSVSVLEPRSIFKTGQEVNEIMKQLANNNNTATYQTEDTRITAFKRANTITEANKLAGRIVSTEDSTIPIYMWFDNGTIWYYTKYEEPQLNKDSSYLFYKLYLINNIELTTLNESNVKVGTIDTSNVTNMNMMFRSCLKLTSLDVSDFDTSKVTNMRNMFCGCRNLESLDLRSFDTKRVTDMANMFCSWADDGSQFGNGMSLTSLNISSFDTSKVIDFYNMFAYCKKLANLDVSSFNTSSAIRMYGMFNYCSSLESLNLSNFDTRNVGILTTGSALDYQGMHGMFAGCEKLQSLDLSSFDTRNVTTMQDMFMDCSSLTSLDLSSFDTSKVTNMHRMMYSCTNLTTIYASDKFITNSVTNSNTMFYDDTSLRGENGTTYNSSKTDKTYARIDGGPTSSTPGYFTDIKPHLAENNIELEYIESTGTQYIDTGVKGTSNIKIDVTLSNSNITQSTHFIGSREQYLKNAIGISKQYESHTKTTRFAGGTIIYDLADSDGIINTQNINNYILDIKGKKVYINNRLINSISEDIEFTSDYNIYIFTVNNGGNPHSQMASIKVYQVKIYDGNTLVRDYIPVHNSITNSAGLYDKVHGRFYPNNGTGTFTEGPAVNN